MTKSPEILLTEPAYESITCEGFEIVFADWLAKSAYLDTVEVNDGNLSPEIARRYEGSVDAARDKIYELTALTDVKLPLSATPCLDSNC